MSVLFQEELEENVGVFEKPEDESAQVLVCTSCRTKNVDPLIDDKGKSYCNHCGERLVLKRNPKTDDYHTNSTTADKVLAYSLEQDKAGLRNVDTVVRVFSTHWGRLRISISTRSNYIPVAYFVDANGDSTEVVPYDEEGNVPDGYEFPQTATHIRQMINGDYDAKLQRLAQKSLALKVDSFAWEHFVMDLQGIISGIHADAGASRFLDLDKVAVS